MNVAKTSRNTGLDVLRILSMVFIVILHYLGAGGVLDAVEFGTTEYMIAWSLESLAFVGVNCFVLISGFFLSVSTWKVSRIFRFYCHTCFYAVLCLMFSVVIDIDNFEIIKIIQSFTPSASGLWWYCSCYFQLLCLMPILNYAISVMESRIYRGVILLLLISTCIVPSVLFWRTDSWSQGNDVFWFVTLYMIAGYIRKYPPRKKQLRSSRKLNLCIVVYFLSCLCMLLSRIVLSMLTQHIFGQVKGAGLFYTYNSILCATASIALFLFFVNVEIGAKPGNVIQKIAPLTFGVYLWHANPNISRYLFKFINAESYAHRPAILLLYMVVVIIAFFGIGILLDFVFMILYKPVEKITKQIDDKITMRVNI